MKIGVHAMNLLVAALFVLLGGCQTPPPADESATFRVLTYNIHHAEGPDGRIDVLRIAEVIQRERADIVALQEVDRGVARTMQRDLPAELAELTGLTAVFRNNHFHQGGEYGNAILSRFPILRVTNTHYRMLRAGEQRGLLQLVLDVHGREVVFMNTHLDYRPDDAERLSNVEEIRQAVGGYASRPVFICGDFNAVPGSRTYTRMSEAFEDCWLKAGTGEGLTFSSEQPRKRIDYIWATNGVVPLRLWVPPSEASDHLPLAGEFRLR